MIKVKYEAGSRKISTNCRTIDAEFDSTTENHVSAVVLALRARKDDQSIKETVEKLGKTSYGKMKLSFVKENQHDK